MIGNLTLLLFLLTTGGDPGGVDSNGSTEARAYFEEILWKSLFLNKA